jgi:isopenicillin-N epimerase
MNTVGTWPTTAEEESYWDGIREQFMVGEGETYFNTGSFGSQPRPVFDSMMRVLQEIEANPTRNRAAHTSREAESRSRLAAFVNAPAEDIAFTTNVTMSINMAVHGLDWNPGDEILASDQEYGAIDNCLDLAAKRHGAVIVRAKIPVPPENPEDILEAFESMMGPKTRLLVCSHITSGTGLIVPIKELAELAHAHGAMIAVDGAHAPGMIPLDLSDLACDFYGGNCHKWLCAPKGTGLLYASPEAQERLHHVVVSWGYNREGSELGDNGRRQINGKPYMWGIENWGTRDQACFIAVEAAIAFQEQVGRARIAQRGRDLAAYLRQRMGRSGWADLISPTVPSMSGSISTFRLHGLQDIDLYADHRITAPFGKDGEAHRVRVSTHICNGFDQIDKLMDALESSRK